MMGNWIDLGTIVALGALIYTIVCDVVERKKQQAIKIACWLFDDYKIDTKYKERHSKKAEYWASVVVSNTSEQPIYDVVVSIDTIYQNSKMTQIVIDNAEYVQLIPPGTFCVDVPWSGQGMNRKFNSSITFRDCAGIWWRRDAAGNIQKSNKSSIQLYNIILPRDSAEIHRIDSAEIHRIDLR